MASTLMLSEWEDYRNKVLPKNAGTIQLKETRQAFFAGAICLFCKMNEIMEPGLEPTEKDLNKVSAIWDELKNFQP